MNIITMKRTLLTVTIVGLVSGCANTGQQAEDINSNADYQALQKKLVSQTKALLITH